MSRSASEREREYCHAEKLARLDALPPTGFQVALFPVLIEGASGGWCRPVAFVPAEASSRT